jgi:hypothetical protein
MKAKEGSATASKSDHASVNLSKRVSYITKKSLGLGGFEAKHINLNIQTN